MNLISKKQSFYFVPLFLLLIMRLVKIAPSASDLLMIFGLSLFVFIPNLFNHQLRFTEKLFGALFLATIAARYNVQNYELKYLFSCFFLLVSFQRKFMFWIFLLPAIYLDYQNLFLIPVLLLIRAENLSESKAEMISFLSLFFGVLCLTFINLQGNVFFDRFYIVFDNVFKPMQIGFFIALCLSTIERKNFFPILLALGAFNFSFGVSSTPEVSLFFVYLSSLLASIFFSKMNNHSKPIKVILCLWLIFGAIF